MSRSSDTIFALSSGRPPAAIAVVRISGPLARTALEKLTGRLPEPRRAALARVRDPDSGETIDQALALWFPGPKSETGEDMAELQLHGGRAVIAATLAALGRLPGFRPAEAGEFTRRAFTNGQLDLTAVEGLADLIGAETEAQRRQAVRQLRGALGKRAEAWRARLIDMQARIEASLDFSDEGDVADDLAAGVLRDAAALRDEIRAVLADNRRGERLREGLTIAIAGPPNAGKSTLFNWLAGREAAIVSPYPGTTRDVLEVHLELEGYPVTVLDTAGVRPSRDPIEQEGIARARARAAEADLVLWVEDLSADAGAGPAHAEAAASGIVDDPEGASLASAAPVWRVLNKADLIDEAARGNRIALPSAGAASFGLASGTDATFPASGETASAGLSDVSVLDADSLSTDFRANSDAKGGSASEVGSDGPSRGSARSFIVSAHTGANLDLLLAALADFARDSLGAGQEALITRERHRHLLNATLDSLNEIVELDSSKEDLIAEGLRRAAAALGRLVGRVDVEDVLDAVFRDFCIGK